MPERHGDRPPQDAGRMVQRDAVLGRRARPAGTGRGKGHPRPAAGRGRAGHAAQGGARARRRRGLRPRHLTQPARRPVDRRRGPGPGGRPRRALRPAGPAGTAVDAGRRAGAHRGARPRPVPRFTATVLAGITRRAVARLAGRAGSPWPGCGRSTTWSTPPTTSCSSWASPTTPTTSTGCPAGASSSAGPRAGETLVTLDGVERRLTADDCLICDAASTPVGIAGIMGGAVVGDLRRHEHGAARGGLLHADGDRPHRQAARVAHRGPGPIRAGLRPRDHRPGRRPVRLAAAPGVPPAPHAARPSRSTSDRRTCPRPSTVRGPHRAGQRHPRHLAHRRRRRRPAGADRLRRRAGPSPGSHAGHHPDLAPRQRAGDRRHRGGGPPLRLRQHRADPAPGRPHRGRPHPLPAGAPPGPGHPGRRRADRGVDHHLPGARRPRAGRPARREPSRSKIRWTAPSRCCARRCCPACSRRSASTPTARRPTCGCSRSATSSACRRPASVLPDEREDLAVIVAGEGADAVLAARLWAVLADAPAARRRRARGRRARRASTRPERRLVVVRQRRGPRRGRRGRPDGVGRLRAGRPGRVHRRCRSRRWSAARPPRPTRPGRSAGSRPATSTWPSWSTTTCRPPRSRRPCEQAGGDLVERVELFDVYRGPQLGAGARSLAYRLRLRALDQTLTDAEVAECAERQIDAVAVVAHGGRMRRLAGSMPTGGLRDLRPAIARAGSAIRSVR